MSLSALFHYVFFTSRVAVEIESLNNKKDIARLACFLFEPTLKKKKSRSPSTGLEINIDAQRCHLSYCQGWLCQGTSHSDCGLERSLTLNEQPKDLKLEHLGSTAAKFAWNRYANTCFVRAIANNKLDLSYSHPIIFKLVLLFVYEVCSRASKHLFGKPSVETADWLWEWMNFEFNWANNYSFSVEAIWNNLVTWTSAALNDWHLTIHRVLVVL